ncbi:MAG: hypothetical protein IKD16_02290, partial [Bacteroidales bacterium]|nr:hypothetical protein [Bacteroidales bacterium]
MKRNLTILLSLLMPVMAGAQSADDIKQAAGVEITKEKSLWYNTNNASGLVFTPLDNFNDVTIGYKSNSGDFKMSQSGENEGIIGVGTQGALNLGGTMLWGAFNYENITTNDNLYNTNMFDPFRDMPYYVADPVISKWKKQTYDLRLKAGFPVLWDFWGIGCEIDYITNTAAKQNDPRSENYYYTLSVRPGFTFKLSDNHQIGINGVYEYLFERAAFNNSDSQTDQPVFVMRGLGNYSPGIVGGIGGLQTHYWKGNKIGGAFQYSFLSNGAFKALLDVKYNYKVEDAYQAPTKPQRMGSTEQNLMAGTLQLLLDGERFTNKLTVGYTDKSTDGIEYIQVVDNTYEVQQWVTLAQYIRSNYSLKVASLKYDFFANSERGYSWRAGVTGEYSDKFDEYYLPNSTLKAENIYFSIYGKKNFALSKKSTLLFGINFGYNSNIDGYYNYSGSCEGTDIVDKMYANDIAFMTTNYMRLGGELNFSTMVAQKTALFISANCQYLNPDNDLFSNRTNLAFSLG